MSDLDKILKRLDEIERTLPKPKSVGQSQDLLAKFVPVKLLQKILNEKANVYIVPNLPEGVPRIQEISDGCPWKMFSLVYDRERGVEFEVRVGDYGGKGDKWSECTAFAFTNMADAVDARNDLIRRNFKKGVIKKEADLERLNTMIIETGLPVDIKQEVKKLEKVIALEIIGHNDLKIKELSDENELWKRRIERCKS